MNRYRALTPAGEAMFGEDEFDAEFGVDEEQDWIGRGVLELVPRDYVVLVDTFTVDGAPVPQGPLVAAFPVELESALIGSGVLARDDPDDEPDDDGDTGEPAKTASKAVWVEYAESLGIDTTDLSKADIQAAIESAEE